MTQVIALEFRRKFEQINIKKEQTKNVKDIAHIKHNGRDVLYIIAKEFNQQKPTLETFFKSIINFRKFCEENEIRKIGLPRMGSGLDKLKWKEVRTIIRYIFKTSKIKVIICVDI